MTGMGTKRKPNIIRLRVKSKEYPKGDKCGLCGGEVEKTTIEFPIVRDYDEGWIRIDLVDFPVLICHGQCDGQQWFLRKLSKSLETTVDRLFQAVLEGKELSKVYINPKLAELVT